jgi:DNA-directed RNA polymerase alpha subunit
MSNQSFSIPTPTLSKITEHNDLYKFTLGNVNVSLANAIRRTILSDIPTLGFYTEIHKKNRCNIEINTTRMHNELIKHRLSCIPVHMKEHNVLPENYLLELDVENTTETTIIVTTQDFKIRNKETNNYLTENETKKIFPPNNLTQMYIDFVRLRPKISENIPGEHIKLTADFSVHTAKENSVYNVVSKCTYSNTLDDVKINEVWDKEEEKLAAEEVSKEDIAFQKKNFYLLDAERHFIPNSFDFSIQTIGVYDNKEIVKKACDILITKLEDLIHALDSNIVPINISETTMDNCYDIILENEDYTLGKVLEYILYERYYQVEKILTFCGFKIFHPHDSSGTIRLAFSLNTDKNSVSQYMRRSCVEARDFFVKVNSLF